MITTTFRPENCYISAFRTDPASWATALKFKNIFQHGDQHTLNIGKGQLKYKRQRPTTDLKQEILLPGGGARTVKEGDLVMQQGQYYEDQDEEKEFVRSNN